ncbi:restriction endonuclease [Sulfurimonas sediminis]|uniref:Restriction endonuclease n=1 Tax=Sulfurimonas sediminis TaxID=2590020 RepID=A0A7M1B4L6_9BACT|nr:restriction endonuclease [Sulfurimonas sediminis]QOP43642.1 restriction endonuclease [Sulfurimonas sediminis]
MDLNTLKELSSEINFLEIVELKEHSKASELYISIKFKYQDGEIWEGWIPYRYRRAGIDIETPQELLTYLIKIYPFFKKEKRVEWYRKELQEWKADHNDKSVTKPYFDAMAKGNWACRKCVDKITKSSNNARRIQDIKEMGYLMATNTKMYCFSCKINTTHDLLIPIDKAEPTGYETWSPNLRKRILKVLNFYDAYEDRIVSKSTHMIPDHKFPEIRWDENTKEINPDDMSDQEIKDKFQLLTNQRNLQKREVCRQCYQTDIRGKPFGINYFYEGDENWSPEVKSVGKEAEKGCVGCGWYDLKKWREGLNSFLLDS